MGIISLDFDRILLFGGEQNGREFKDAYIYEVYKEKFYQFSDLNKNSNFVMSPVFFNGKYIVFDFLNNIHELNLETMQFEHYPMAKDMPNAEDELLPNV